MENLAERFHEITPEIETKKEAMMVVQHLEKKFYVSQENRTLSDQIYGGSTDQDDRLFLLRKRCLNV